MSLIGMYCSDKELALRIGETVLALQATYRQEYVKIAWISESLEKTQIEYLFLLLSCETVRQTIAMAERFWEEYLNFSIVCVVCKPEEVFDVLPYPFFHIVRSYALEQDLEAVLKKLERIRPVSCVWKFFQCKNELVRVKVKDILYVESQRHEIIIHLLQNEKEEQILMTSETLTECEEKLKSEHFVRIHKSFLVNFYHIEKMERNCITLDNGTVLYMSRSRYPEVKLQFEQYIRHMDFLY